MNASIPTLGSAELGLIARARDGVCGPGAAAVTRDCPGLHARPAIAGYEMIREIGRGGQGVVFQARQVSTGRDVAIKMLRHGMLATSGEQARLEREVRILAQLRHPGIVTIHDSGTTGGLSYVVMDYIDGGPLDAYLADARPPLCARVELFARIADAVHAAHVRGVIHRDLKPANIRVDAEGRPRILDFGVAKLLEAAAPFAPLTMTGQFIGSLQWSAPEQARGDQAAVDVRTDVYALGVIFWQGIAGTFPYPVDGDVSRVLARIISAEPCAAPRRGERMPADLETILRRCLRKEPARRYQSAGEVADDLRRYREGRPIAARRDSSWYVLRKTIARHRIMFGLIVVTMLTAIGSAVGFAWMYRESEAARRDVERANRELRRDLFAATPSLPPVVGDFDDGRLDDRFVPTGDVRVERGRLIADCATGNEAAWTLIPSRAVLRGDFDISVDFELETDEPLTSGAIQCAIHLVNVRMGGYVSWVARYREKDPQCADLPEDAYVAGGQGNCPPGRAATSDAAGRLRIARRGSQSTSYYWSGEGWTPLHQEPITDDVLGFEIVVRRILSGAPLRISLDNLVVETVFPDRPECLEDFHEEFDGHVIDPRLVAFGDVSPPSEAGGRLGFLKMDGFSGSIGAALDATRFQLCGDFDLSVDYWLADWPEPTAGEHFAGMALLRGSDGRPVARVERVRDRSGTDRTIRDYFRVGADDSPVATLTTLREGGLCFARTGDQVEVSIREGAAWRMLLRAAIPADNLSFRLYAGATDTAQRSHVHIDNLRLQRR